jgi:hypothetical protein
MLKNNYRTRHQHCGFAEDGVNRAECVRGFGTRQEDNAKRKKEEPAIQSDISEIENFQIHRAVQGRKGDEAWAGESPVVATGMMILERSEPW